MAKSKRGRGTTNPVNDLTSKLQNYYNSIDTSQDKSLEDFKKAIKNLREFLKTTTSVKSGYFSAMNHLICNSQDYRKFKVKFTHAENFFERMVELDENENFLSKTNGTVEVDKIYDYLTDEFNKLFYKDVEIEIEKIKSYLSTKNFVMVGCGSLPITLLVFCAKYPEMSFIGIDNSPEAIRKAIDLKLKLNIKNLSFNIIDGMNYDYKDATTIFVANTVVAKMHVLKQIAMSAKSGTKIIIRVPELAGNLLSEDVIYNSIPRIQLLTQIDPDEKTDDLLYKLLVLEVR